MEKRLALTFSFLLVLAKMLSQVSPQLVNPMAHTDGVLQLACSPSQQYVASLGSKSNLIIWERVSKTKVKVIKTKVECSEILFLSDTTIALFSLNNISLINIKTEEQSSISLSFGYPKEIAFDGENFICLTESDSLFKFKKDFTNLILVSDSVSSFDSSEGEIYVLRDRNQLYALDSDLLTLRLEGSVSPEFEVTSFRMLNNKNGLILSLKKGDVIFCDKNNGSSKKILSCTAKISSLVLDKSKTKMIIPTEEYSCILLDLDELTEIKKCFFKDYMTSALIFDDSFWVSSWDGNIYNLTKELDFISTLGDEPLKSTCFEFLGENSIAVGFNDGSVKLISSNGSMSSIDLVNPEILPFAYSHSITSIQFSAEKKFLSVTDDNGNWFVYDLTLGVIKSHIKFKKEIHSQELSESSNSALIVTADSIFLYNYNFELISSSKGENPWFISLDYDVFTVNDQNGFHFFDTKTGNTNFSSTKNLFKFEDDKYICDVKCLGTNEFLFLTYDGILGIDLNGEKKVLYNLGCTVNFLHVSPLNHSVYILTQENELIYFILAGDYKSVSNKQTVKFDSPENSTWSLRERENGELLISSGYKIYKLDPTLKSESVFKEFNTEIVSASDSRFSFNLSRNEEMLFAILETGQFNFELLKKYSLADSICVSCLYHIQNAKKILGIESDFSLINSDDYPLRFSSLNNVFFDLYIFKNGDWLVYDEDFRFDGSGESMKKLHFNCELEVIELVQIKDALYVPKLAGKLVNGEDINYKKLNQLDICGSLPIIELASETEENWIFNLKYRRWPVNSVVIRIDDRPIKTIDLKDSGFDGKEVEVVVSKKEIEKHYSPGRSNKVTVNSICQNQDLEFKSRGFDIVVLAEGEPKEPKLFMLLIGVNEYKDQSMNLQFPVHDARLFGQALSCSAERLLGKGKVVVYNVQNVVDGNEVYTTPEREGILKALRDIAKKSTANDILLIFFAGHGVMQGSDGSFTFLTSDASKLNQIGISTIDLAQWLNPEGPLHMKPNKTILIYDACNSGQAVLDFTARNSDDETERLRQIADLGDKRGLFILAASAPNQSAFETPGLEHGLLTYSLLYTLKNNTHILDDNISGGGYLNLQKWFLETEKEQSKIANSFGLKQQAQPLGTSNILIGKVDSYVRECIPTVENKPFVFCGNARDFNEGDPLDLKYELNKSLSENNPRDSNIKFRYAGTETNFNYTLRIIYEVRDSIVKCNILIFKDKKNIEVLKVESEAANIVGEINEEINNYFIRQKLLN
jgi:hypothetical protein